VSGRFALPAVIALCLGLGACGLFYPAPPMPPYELAPGNDQVRAALSVRFAAAKDPAGGPCTDDFALGAIAIREAAQALYTERLTYAMDARAAYTVTLRKPAPNPAAPKLAALVQACFGAQAQAPADWPVGEARPVFLSAAISPAGGAWALAIYAGDNKPDETIPMANAATPHPFKIGVNRWWPR
jgi:hypothetical protein